MRQFVLQAPSATLQVRDSGSGVASTVILIHGGPGLVGYMEGLGACVSGKNRVIDYEQRGTFQSPSPGPFTLQSHAEDLKHLIQETCPQGKPLLIAHSLGGLIGLYFCARFPGLARSLILVGCAPLDKGGREKMDENINIRLSPRDLATTEALYRTINDETLLEEERIQADLALVKLLLPVYQYDPSSVMSYPFHPRNLKASFASGRDFAAKQDSGEFLKLLKEICLPVYAFHGCHDVIPHANIFSQLTACLPTPPKTFLINEAGHLPWLEKNARDHFVTLLQQAIAAEA